MKKENGRQNIRVNAVCPGNVETGILEGLMEGGREYLQEHAKQTHPIGRAAQPKEIAEVIVFAASPQASFITGALLPVDGGYTAV